MMPQSLSNILVHVVFSTKNRENLLIESITSELYKYLAQICKNNNSPIKQIGGINNHIHMLLDLSRSISISKLISEIKSNSTRWLKTKGSHLKNFSWQNGYGVFSIGESGLLNCQHYIKNQKEHHKKISFEEELKLFLKKYSVNYDERYLFD